MKDIDIQFTIYTKPSIEFNESEQLRQIEYALNECCSKLEDLKCDVSYKIRVDGKPYRGEYL